MMAVALDLLQAVATVGGFIRLEGDMPSGDPGIG